MKKTIDLNCTLVIDGEDLEESYFIITSEKYEEILGFKPVAFKEIYGNDNIEFKDGVGDKTIVMNDVLTDKIELYAYEILYDESFAMSTVEKIGMMLIDNMYNKFVHVNFSLDKYECECDNCERDVDCEDCEYFNDEFKNNTEDFTSLCDKCKYNGSECDVCEFEPIEDNDNREIDMYCEPIENCEDDCEDCLYYNSKCYTCSATTCDGCECFHIECGECFKGCNKKEK